MATIKITGFNTTSLSESTVGDSDTGVIDGNVTLGSNNSDNIVFEAEIDSNFVPDDDGQYDIGSSSKKWNNGYFNQVHSNQRDIKVAYYNYGGTEKRFIRFATTGTTNSDTETSANSVMIAPANGELLSVKIRTKSASGDTTIGFHKASDSTPLPITNWATTDSDTVTVANANTTYTADFTSATFNSGDILGISVLPTTKTDDTQITALFVFDWTA